MKRLISIAVSLTILGIIYWRIDIGGIAEAFAHSKFWVLAGGILMVAPITWMTAWRFTRLAPAGTPIGAGEATRLVLAASSLNMVLPSKMGDLAKAWFIRDRGHMAGGRALALVVYEKALDMISLLVWCALGLAVYPDKGALFWIMTLGVACGLFCGLISVGSRQAAILFFDIVRRCVPKKAGAKVGGLAEQWADMHAAFWADRKRVLELAVISLALWFLHLFQIWLFVLALGAVVPLLDNLALAPLAILAGLLPLTFAGIGTRDAALIFFFAPYMAPAAGAALGLLCTLRYILPAAAGAPFLGNYLDLARRGRRNSASDPR